jgi:hypothetical protein
VIGSLLFPGNTLSHLALPEALWHLEGVLRLTPSQRRQVRVRLDGGFGTDASLEWVLRQGYQLCAKGFSGKRAGTQGRKVSEWVVLEPERRWTALAPQQLQFSVPTRTILVRWLTKKKQLKHALYIVTDLTSSLEEVCHAYDLRAGAEVEIRNDKQGLLLTHRRKRTWPAQQMLILLTDLAHNFLSCFRRVALAQTPLAGYGAYRLVQEVLNIPGEVVVQANHVVEVHFQASHPHAEVMAEALRRFC